MRKCCSTFYVDKQPLKPGREKSRQTRKKKNQMQMTVIDKCVSNGMKLFCICINFGTESHYDLFICIYTR